MGPLVGGCRMLLSGEPGEWDSRGPRTPEPKPFSSSLLLCLYVCLSVSAFLSFLPSLLELGPSFFFSMLQLLSPFSFSVSSSLLLF